LMLLSIAAALATIALKASAWLITGSVGFLSDAAESIVNLVAAIVALIAIRVAIRPPDDDHAYGHEKAEYFSAGAEGALVLVAAVGIAWVAGTRLLDPQPLSDVGAGVAVSAVAAALKFRTELREVVNLAVEYDCYRAVLVKDRLMSAGKIDDAEAAHAESHRALRVDALIVGSAMHYSVAHGTDRGAINPCAPVFTDDSCNPAHP